MTHFSHPKLFAGPLLAIFLIVSVSVAAQPLSAAPARQPMPPAPPDAGGVALDLPPLSPEVIESARRLYQSGLAQGNNPDSFILIGDSNDAQSRFFQAFSTGNYTLGPYAYLQPVIDAYNATGSFGAAYSTSDHGMTLSTLMDPAFVNPALCPQATSVLDCTLQRYQPSVAIIYMGTYDTCFAPFDVYRDNFERAMQLLTERGVIAILTEYTVALDEGCWEDTPAYTAVIREMAARYRMPWIELSAHVESLPQWGMESDGWHLSWPDDFHTSFAGGETLYGSTQRELLTLQMLYLLRRDVMGIGG